MSIKRAQEIIALPQGWAWVVTNTTKFSPGWSMVSFQPDQKEGAREISISVAREPWADPERHNYHVFASNAEVTRHGYATRISDLDSVVKECMNAVGIQITRNAI